MDLERDLSPAFDDAEPAWGDEDAVPRAESLWRARARASVERLEPHDGMTPAPVPELAAIEPAVATGAPEIVHDEPTREDLAWFAPQPEPMVALDDPDDLVHREDQGEARDDTSWFAAPEPAPGTVEAMSQANEGASAPATAAQPEFPPAWFPSPGPADDPAPSDASMDSTESADALSAALARFEAGQPLPGDEPAVAVEASLEPTRDVHAWFATPQAFLDTLSAEAASVSEATAAQQPPVVADDEPADPPAAAEAAMLAGTESGDDLFVVEPAVSEAVTADEGPAYDVSPAVSRWRAAQEASLQAWVAAATRTIEAWPVTAATAAAEEAVAAQACAEVAAEDSLEPAAIEPALVLNPPALGIAPCFAESVDADPPAADVAGPTMPLVPAPAPVAVPASSLAAAPSPMAGRRRPWKRGRVAGVAAASLAGVVVVVTMLVPRLSISQPAAVAAPSGTGAVAAAAPAPTVATSVPAAPSRVVTAPPPVAPAGPAWHETNEWTGGRKKSVAFELAAERPVRTWMRHVTPVLVVRCLNGTIDTFVVTHSPSAIEPGRTDHAVRLAFDDAAVVEERWIDSAEHDGLFAPDGRSVLDRGARSGRLRFVFQPHNAPAAEATFQLAGLETLQGPLTKFCK
jgi:hypothetical protein